MMNVDKIERKIDRQFHALGRDLVIPVNNRVAWLLARMRLAGFPITGLLMGNGAYFLRGGEFEVFYSDESRGSLPIDELFDFDENKVWTPVCLNARTEKWITEARDLLDYILDAPYLPLLSLDSQDLDKAEKAAAA